MKRRIVLTPALVATLRTLEPGDHVDCRNHWSYATIRQTASNMKLPIYTAITEKGITVWRKRK